MYLCDSDAARETHGRGRVGPVSGGDRCRPAEATHLAKRVLLGEQALIFGKSVSDHVRVIAEFRSCQVCFRLHSRSRRSLWKRLRRTRNIHSATVRHESNSGVMQPRLPVHRPKAEKTSTDCTSGNHRHCTVLACSCGCHRRLAGMSYADRTCQKNTTKNRLGSSQAV